MRSLTPLLAIIGIVALPVSLAQPPGPTKSTDVTATTPTNRIDSPREIQVIRLSHATSERLARILSEVFPVGMAQAGGSLRVVPDVRQNSLILSGSPETVAKAREIIQEADKLPVELARTEVVRVKHGRAAEIAGSVRESLNKWVVNEGYVNANAFADDRSSSIILNGSNASLAAMKSLIESLDVPSVDSPATASSTRVRVTVHSVDVAPDRTATMSSARLSDNAADEEAFQAGLAKIGSTRHLYTVDQFMDLSTKPTVNIGASVPIPQSSNKSKDGAASTSVTYQNQGLHLEIKGDNAATNDSHHEVQAQLELSCLTDSNISLGSSINAPIIHKVVQSFGGGYSPGTPIVLLTIESSPAKQNATAYVTRIELTKPAARG